MKVARQKRRMKLKREQLQSKQQQLKEELAEGGQVITDDGDPSYVNTADLAVPASPPPPPLQQHHQINSLAWTKMDQIPRPRALYGSFYLRVGCVSEYFRVITNTPL